MALYQGANPLFKYAITRSAARPFSINVKESDVRVLPAMLADAGRRAICSTLSCSTART